MSDGEFVSVQVTSMCDCTAGEIEKHAEQLGAVVSEYLADKEQPLCGPAVVQALVVVASAICAVGGDDARAKILECLDNQRVELSQANEQQAPASTQVH